VTLRMCPMLARSMPYAGAGEPVDASLDPEYAAEMAARSPCIGDACMWHRWVPAKRVNVSASEGKRLQAQGFVLLPDERTEWGLMYQRPPQPYCGMAGKPEETP
jgi:hypothetical protein